MDAEDAKIVAHRVARRIESARETMVEDESGCLVRRKARLEWHPVLPGSVSLVILGVEWNDDGEGSLIDGVGTEVGTIDYQSGRFEFYDSVGIEGSEQYLVRYAYDMKEAEARLTDREVHILLAGGRVPRLGLVQPGIV